MAIFNGDASGPFVDIFTGAAGNDTLNGFTLDDAMTVKNTLLGDLTAGNVVV